MTMTPNGTAIVIAIHAVNDMIQYATKHCHSEITSYDMQHISTYLLGLANEAKKIEQSLDRQENEQQKYNFGA